MNLEKLHTNNEIDQVSSEFINNRVINEHSAWANQFSRSFEIANRLGLNAAENAFATLLVCGRFVKESRIHMEQSIIERKRARDDDSSTWLPRSYSRWADKRKDNQLAKLLEATVTIEKLTKLGRDHLAKAGGEERIQKIDLAMHDILTRGLYNGEAYMPQRSFIVMKISPLDADEWTRKWSHDLGLKDETLSEGEADTSPKGGSPTIDLFIA